MSITNELNEIFNGSVLELKKVLNDGKKFDEKTKLALDSIKVYSKLRDIMLQENKFKFKVCADLAGDSEELAKYVQATTPELSIKK